MEMGFIRMERMLLAADAAKYYTNYIQTRYQQNAERYDDGGTDGRRWFHTNEHTIFDDQKAHQVSQGQTARIAHEYLPPTVGIAEYIVEEERDEYPCCSKGNHGVHPQTVDGEDGAVKEQGYYAYTGCQAVNTVNEVDGIGDEYDQQDSQGNTEIGSYFVDAKQAVEIIDINTGQWNERSCDNLVNEFVAIADTNQVITDTDEV